MQTAFQFIPKVFSGFEALHRPNLLHIAHFVPRGTDMFEQVWVSVKETNSKQKMLCTILCFQICSKSLGRKPHMGV